MDPFATHLARLRGPLLRTAHSSLRNPHWAEDAVSETLLAAWQRRPGFGDEQRLRAWLFGVLRHKIADQLRQHLGDGGLRVALDLAAADEAHDIVDAALHADPAQHVGQRQFIAALQGELDRLPAPQADAFVMRECLGRESAEICHELAITAGNLWVMLHRTRHRLRHRLAAHAR